MRTAFFLGAGCSYGTLEHRENRFPPIGRDFGPEITKRVADWPIQYPELAKVAEHLRKPLPEAGLEQIWTCIDYHAKFSGAFEIGWDSTPVVRELKSALLVLYGPTCDDEADKLTVIDSYSLGRIVQEIKPQDTLISFNYDTLVERLARQRGINLRHGLGSPREDEVRFAKPHGSASWNQRNLGDDLTDGPPALKSFDPREALLGNIDPLLLGAVPMKSELIREVQHCYHVPRVFDVVLCQWRIVAEALREADRVVVLGYSFPQEDSYGQFFFHEAIRKRPKSLQVEYYELPNKAEQVACAIASAFLGKANIQYEGVVAPAPDFEFTPKADI